MDDTLVLIFYWLIDNPPWAVALAVLLLLLVIVLLYILPDKRQEKAEMKRMLLRMEQEENRANTAQKMQQQKAQRSQAEKDEAGRAFELRIVALLQNGLIDWIETGRAKLLHNIKLPYGQVDVILIDTSGIYVIECKCWSGIVLGRQDWPFWFRLICDFEKGVPKVEDSNQGFPCNAFRNPIEQNKEHKKNLYQLIERHTGRSYKQFKQISVFDKCGNLDFLFSNVSKPGDYLSQYTWFGNKDELLDKIRWYDANMNVNDRLAPQEVNELYSILQAYVEPVA